MSQVFRQKAMSPDELLGRVEQDGKVYHTRLGPDRYVGHVDLSTGKIYADRVGPDAYVGSVDLKSGKVFRQKALAADDYVGSADEHGKLYRQRVLAADEYVGQVTPMISFAHAGAALLLLVLPDWAEDQPDPKGEPPAAKK